MTEGKIGIIGSGLIGRSFAMLFAEAGFRVSIFDVDQLQCGKALELIHHTFQDLEKNNLKKRPTTAKEDCERISVAKDLRECVEGAIYIQECVPEVLELKKKVHREIDEIVEDGVIIASSTSFIVPSLIFEGMSHISHAVVSHPTTLVTVEADILKIHVGGRLTVDGITAWKCSEKCSQATDTDDGDYTKTNPPYFVPFVEIVPSPWTEKSVVVETKKLLFAAGMSPVVLKKEIPGFALNRVQDAIFLASWQLVKEDVLNVEDVDKVMTDGLGLRYAFVGPWETAHLNSEGFERCMEVYAESTYQVQQSFKCEKMEGETVKIMEQDLCKRVPLDELEERRKWRDTAISRLSILKRDMDKNGKTE